MKFTLPFLFFIMLSTSSKAQLKVGDSIPDFELKDQHGDWFRSSKEVGKKIMVIYFYPKDDTPGCTREACSFRDYNKDFAKEDAVIVGISSDDEKKHAQFAAKYDIPFSLLADVDGRVRDKFKVPSDMFGLIPGRVTFVVDKQGIIRYVYNSQLNTEKHISGSLEAIKSFKK